MSEDITKTRGASAAFKDDRGGAVLIPSAVLGIVKNNIDPTRSGKIQVFLNRLGSSDQDNPAYWTTVSYLSPFFGSTPNTTSPDGFGDYVGNPNSYGFWATPPDLNTEVICIFLNGDPNFGYYIGSIPKPGLTHMVPAIGASDNVVPNQGEAQSYGGATRLPVSEINNANADQDNNPQLTKQPRPIHSYQAGIMFKQGLLRDPDRGPISSSSQRESPSRVFGMSTPGRPIYQGGYTDESIGEAVKDENVPDKNFQIVGRRGGHSFVMDDGDLTGKDQLVRLRTATGHQILMNDAAQTLFIIHANGQSYIELGKEGTIDMYSTNSVNIRTQGDLNLHADNNININAANDLNIAATNIRMESSVDTTQLVNGAFKNNTKGDFTVKADGGASIAAQGPASLASGDSAFINGSKVNLNTGSSPLSPEAVSPLTITAHPDTLSNGTTGYSPAPGALESITSRAPAHAPWSEANKGVSVDTNLASENIIPEESSFELASINESVPAAPKMPTTPALVSTVPAAATAASVAAASKKTSLLSSIKGKLSSAAESIKKSALISQMAINSALGKFSSAVKSVVGVITENGKKLASIGALGLTIAQLVKSGHLKPGSDAAINAAIQDGKSVEQALHPSMFTGKDGVNNVTQLAARTDVQVAAASTILDESEISLIQMGIITGNESPAETSGLILSAASAGLGPTVEFTRAVTGKSPRTKIVGQSIMNPFSAPVSDLIAGGTLAAKMAEKTIGTGSLSEQYSDIADSFVPLKAGEPQILTSTSPDFISAAQTSKAEQDSLFKPKESTSTVAANKAKLDKTSADSVFNQVVDMCQPKPTTGQAALASVRDDNLASINSSGSSVSSLKAKLGENVTLTALATSELDSIGTTKVNTEILKISTGGPVPLKLPTTATDTFDTSSLTLAATNILGNEKIPPLDFGTGQTNAASQTEKLSLISLVTAKMDEARNTYLDLKAKLGETDPAVQAALQKWKAATKDYEALLAL